MRFITIIRKNHSTGSQLVFRVCKHLLVCYLKLLLASYHCSTKHPRLPSTDGFSASTARRDRAWISSDRATTAATDALLPAQPWPRPSISMANHPIAQRSPEQAEGGRTGRSEMSMYMRGYEGAAVRARAVEGLSGGQRTERAAANR